jgi:hypothetical protein
MDMRFGKERSPLAAGIDPVVGIVVRVAGTRHTVAEGRHLEAGLDNHLAEGPGTRPAGNEVAEVLQRPGLEVGSPGVDRSLDYRKT